MVTNYSKSELGLNSTVIGLKEMQDKGSLFLFKTEVGGHRKKKQVLKMWTYTLQKAIVDE